MNRVSSHQTLVALSAVAVCILAASVSPAICAEDNELLAVVAAGSKNAVSAVTSGKGALTVRSWARKYPGGPVSEHETVYDVVFKNDNYRISAQTTVLRNDPRQWVKSAKTTPVGTIVKRETAIAGREITYVEGRNATMGTADSANVGTSGYFRTLGTQVLLWDPESDLAGKGLLDISELVSTLENLDPENTRTYAAVTGQEPVDEDECVVVEISVVPTSGDRSKRIVQLWVNPEKGYAIPKLRQFVEGGNYPNRTLVLSEDVELKEYQPGTWHPARVTRKYYGITEQGTAFTTRELTIAYSPGFQVNCPVDATELVLELASGTRVYDENLDVHYTVP